MTKAMMIQQLKDILPVEMDAFMPGLREEASRQLVDREYDNLKFLTDVLGVLNENEDGTVDVNSYATVVARLLDHPRRDDLASPVNWLVGFLDEAPFLRALLETALKFLNNVQYFSAMNFVSFLAYSVMLQEALTRYAKEKFEGGRPPLRLSRPTVVKTNDFQELRNMVSSLWETVDLRNKLGLRQVTAPLMTRDKDFDVRPLLNADSCPGIVPSFEDCERTVTNKTMGVLDKTFWDLFGSHVVLAGGTAAEGCCGQNANIPSYDTAKDADLFLVGLSGKHEAAAFVKLIARFICKRAKEVVRNDPSTRTDGGEVRIMVDLTNNSLNITAASEHFDSGIQVHFEIQIVLRLFTDVEQLLVFFDHGACRFAYDGSHVYVSLSALYAVANGCYFLEPFMMTYPKRLEKYQRRGFVPLCPVTSGFEKCLRYVWTTSDDRVLYALIAQHTLVSVIAYTMIRWRKKQVSDASAVVDTPSVEVSSCSSRDVVTMMFTNHTVGDDESNRFDLAMKARCTQLAEKHGLVWAVLDSEAPESDLDLRPTYPKNGKASVLDYLPERFKVKGLVNLANDRSHDYFALPDDATIEALVSEYAAAFGDK